MCNIMHKDCTTLFPSALLETSEAYKLASTSHIYEYHIYIARPYDITLKNASIQDKNKRELTLET